MTGCAWVPPGTQSPALTGDLATMARDWGEAWFGRPLAVQDAASGDGALYVLGDAVAIALASDDLGALALGSRFAGTRSAADRALLDRVGEAVRDDLYRRVGVVLGCDGKAWCGPIERLAWTPMLSMRFADAAGRLSLTLHLGETCLAAAILARLPAVSSPARPLTPLSRAVAGRQVRLSARLGRCTLRLAEMRDMVVGDTLLFERGVDDPLPVVIDDGATGIATARVVREAAHWTLNVEPGRMEKAA